MGSSKIEFSSSIWKLVIKYASIQIFEAKTEANVILKTQEMVILRGTSKIEYFPEEMHSLGPS